jgi:hypothetical protein
MMEPPGSKQPQFIALKPAAVVRVEAIESKPHQLHVNAIASVAHELHEFRF